MSSIDEENLPRAERDIRNGISQGNEGSAAPWFLAVVVIVAIVGGIYVYSGDQVETAPISTTEPAISEETAPVAPLPE
ncbi:hypothetical protein MWU61_12335 [Loktanella sp. F6476L]|uniref:hypothetical protein n=1 Tax=Loktanella sp. F6476L TaxID=2926405 RepID=UPI001FF31958|nr:hypothetical protein [Loktanella sp. F6476L]MCK0121333.1 hypothetical protein [Loktanella sp. F6476L]